MKYARNKIINHEFKSYKKSALAKRKRKIRILAIVGVLLILSSLIISIIYYL
ncbi:MAG: hypothetical protein IJC57_02105 [Clostridia bacterium]|nr:hypothetical protein [Clostridia bacterium]